MTSGLGPEIWLARHGATEWSESGQHTGRTDVPLTAKGRLQAASLVKPLDRQAFALVLTSPLGRARETARLAGFADAVVETDLLEWDYGNYEGLTTSEIKKTVPGWNVWNGDMPGGETIEQVAERATALLDRCEEVEGRVLFFAHGHILRILAACCLGLGPRAGAQLAIEPASVGVIGHEHDYRTLLRWNMPST
ncbi:MAG: histidine phosphatase family protein [Acidimicrobiia bacterium]|nr:histidine phosphatase family protein [Acidimicrobiia bacterium]